MQTSEQNMEKLGCVYASGGADDTDNHIECALAICAPDWNISQVIATEKLKYAPNEAFSKLNLPKTSRN